MSFQDFYSKNFLINLLISIIPISYIAGNLVLNLNIIILLISALSIYRLEIFKLELELIDKIILIFFSYILLNGILNNFLNFSFTKAPANIVLIKTIFYLRFLLLYFVIKFLINKKIINFKIIFFSFGFCSLFVCIDLLIQFIFEKDIFGYEAKGRRLSGPFGDEYVAGSFIQRFFIFSIFTFLLFFKNKRNWVVQSTLLLTLGLSMFGVLLAGNRIPILLFVLILGMIFIYEKSYRKTLMVFLLIFITSFTFLINSNKHFKDHLHNFMYRSSQIFDYAKTRITTGEVKALNIYIKEIEAGILTWKENKYFGGGIKSFWWNCNKIDRSKMAGFVSRTGEVNCNIHPHNYYLEILAETGIVGLFLIISLFFIISIKVLQKIHLSEMITDDKKKLIPFFIIFFAEIFPLKTTGSFFTTGNATFLFIILAFIVGLIELKSSKNDGK